MNALARLLITVYRWTISPVLGLRCRFYPSCSNYAHQCYQQFSTTKATWYTFRRISKCHPWNSGGIDFPPGQNF